MQKGLLFLAFAESSRRNFEMYFCSDPLQIGFKPLHYIYTGIVMSSHDTGYAVLGCFLDAFDMVDHGIVCFVMEVYLCLFLGSCCLGMLHNKCRCIGDLVFRMCFMFLMVFGRVVSSVFGWFISQIEW